MDLGSNVIDPHSADLRGVQRAKTFPLQPQGFAAYIDAAFGKQILHVSEGQRTFHVHQYDEADRIGRSVVIKKRVGQLGDKTTVRPR